MSLTQQGIDGENKAFRQLVDQGFKLQQTDFIIEGDDKWAIVEVKYKKLFRSESRDFVGTGLNISQLKLRLKLQEKLNLPVILYTIDKETNDVYWQFLGVLEHGHYFDTPSKIRIYAINNFFKNEPITL